MNDGISIIIAYYNNLEMLNLQINNFSSYPPSIRQRIEFILIDDGSTSKPAPVEHFTNANFKVKLFKVLKDTPWNQDGARNIGAKHSEFEFLLFTDMDHLIPSDSINGLLTMKWRTDRVYRFIRTGTDGKRYVRIHENSFACHKATYWKAGGYDEDYRGIYGTDWLFWKDLEKVASFATLETIRLVHVKNKQIPDADTTTLTRNSSSISNRLRRRIIKNLKRFGLMRARGTFRSEFERLI